MDTVKERIILRFIQISDTHITRHRNLLKPILESINQEKQIDFVIATGDIANFGDRGSLELANNTLKGIKHKVIVLPGDYDGSLNWSDYFGERYKSLIHNELNLHFLDTTFIRHRYFVGWADVMFEEDPIQYEWLKEQLQLKGYHIIFSHHPIFTMVEDNMRHELLTDNLRAMYSGHLHQTQTLYFAYDKPNKHFNQGFSTVPMKFHGNVCYVVASVSNTYKILNEPKMVGTKRTAW